MRLLLRETKHVAVESSFGNLIVDLEEAKCSRCGSGCRHVLVATDFLRNNARKNTWNIISAMHKEIRRSNFDRALYYSKWLSLSRSNISIMRYLVDIVFEETRNVPLYLTLLKCTEPDRAIQLISHSVKKWEDPSRSDIFKRKTRAMSIATKLKCPGEIHDPVSFGTFDEAVVYYFSGRIYDDDKSWREIYARKLMESKLSDMSRELLEKAHKFKDYILLTVLEIEYGLLSENMFLYHPQQEFKVDFTSKILDFEPYVNDLHTFYGKSLIKDNWIFIKPMEPMPDRIDLRWSGSILGSLWRHKAYEQFGEEVLEKKWEDVKISPKEWENAKWYDSYFYKSLYFEMEARLV